jgi:hypothetical protein
MRKILTTAVLLIAFTGFAKAEPTAEEQRCFDAINNRNRLSLSYQERLFEGRAIRSGVVEGACKIWLGGD